MCHEGPNCEWQTSSVNMVVKRRTVDMLPSRNRFVVGFLGWVEIEQWIDNEDSSGKKNGLNSFR